MVVKTFRGILADGGQDHIRLSTIKGKVGYRIAKFQIISETPSTTAPESIVKIFKAKQTSVSALINFTDTDLLAAAYYSGADVPAQPQDITIIFDKEIFNQDIYITHVDNDASVNMNYYLVLEVIPLDDAGAEFTTLKDLRSR